MKDKNNVLIQIGDIVKIENSPIKADNAVYVVAQDGTSKGYTGTGLTMYKVAKHKAGYSLSRSSYNICFYPLCNFSSRYSFTREEMNAATIEILLKANNTAFNIVKNDDKYEAEETDQTYFRAVVKIGEKEIEDTSYPANEQEKMIAFFSNITLKQGETIEICKQDHSWGYYYRNISYKLERAETTEQIAELQSKVIEEVEAIEEAPTMTTETITTETVTEIPEPETTAQETQPEATREQPEAITRIYYSINETLARQAQGMWSFSDYSANSTTNSYKTAVNEVYEIVDRIQAEKPHRLEDALRLAEKYSRKYAEWINKGNAIEMRCPSVMICGAGNFPVRKKEKQNRARDSHQKEYEYINGYITKLENILTGKEIIKSADADAIAKLQEKVEQLEKLQETMKAANAYYKKNNTLDGFEMDEKLKVDCYRMIKSGWSNRPFPAYELTNNNAKINNTKDRLEQLKKAKEAGIKESIQSDICKVIENTEIMRIQLIFDGKPSEQIRNILKSNGFVWAPSHGAWQRQMTSNGRYATKQVLDQLNKIA